MKFIRLNDEVIFFDYDKIEIQDKLPHGIYQLKGNDENNSSNSLKMLKESILETNVQKLYSPLNKYFDRIYTEFTNSKCKHLGCLFSGVKGTGKTLVSNKLCHKLYKDGYSIWLVNKQIDSYDLIEIIKTIDNDLVIFIDEFEKIISDKRNRDTDEISNQEKLLNFLGNDNNIHKTLVLLTANNIYSINTNLLNRPGRIKYHFVSKTLNDKSIIEYCNDYLQNKDRLNDILKIGQLSMIFTFDILKVVVNQINTYNDTIEDIFEFLNINKDPNDNYDVLRFNISIFDTNDNLICTKIIDEKYSYFLYNTLRINIYDAHYNNSINKEIFKPIEYRIDLKKCNIETETEKYKIGTFFVDDKLYKIRIELIEAKLEHFAYCDIFDNDDKYANQITMSSC